MSGYLLVIAAIMLAGVVVPEQQTAGAPPAGESLLPYFAGATVPPPFEPQTPHPAPHYCPSSSLTGSIVGRGDHGVLTLRLKPAVRRQCEFPQMLDSNALRLLDRAGQLRSRSRAASDQFPINPPSFRDAITLTPGEAASMYLRARGRARCGSPVTHAVIRYDSVAAAMPLTIPVTGLGNCAAETFVHGPFSTPDDRVAFENEHWSDFHATLNFPAEMPTAGRVTFRATLSNRGALALPLTPCPKYGLDISDGTYGSYDTRSIGCPQQPRVVEPGQRITFTFTHRIASHLTPGKYRVKWAIAGVRTAPAETTVR